MRRYAKWCRRFGRRNPSRRATGPYHPRCTVSHTVLSRHRRLLDSLERECEKIIDLRADNMDRSEFYTVVATLQSVLIDNATLFGYDIEFPDSLHVSWI